jgi:acetylornithine deacetylase
MKDVVTILKDLIALPSINPMGRTDISEALMGEARVVEYICGFLKNIGLEPLIQNTELPGRNNVGTVLYKGDKHKTILIQAHTDTVDMGNDLSLLSPVEKGGKIYGRGACDDKGSLAAMLAALAQIVSNPSELQNNIVFFAVADEEYTWKGSKKLVSDEPGKNADFGIVGEPTGCCLVNGYKGVARWDMTTSGKSCHSSEPEKGVNAIYRMAKVLQLIENYQQELAMIEDPPIGKETISVGRINGGTTVNIVPDHCVIEIDRRLTRKTSPKQALKNLRIYLESHGVDFKISYSTLKDAQNASYVSENHPGIQLALKILRMLKLDTQPQQVAFGSDAYRMNNAGIPTVLLGPGSIHVAHSKNEYIPITELKKAKDFYYEMMKKNLQSYDY